MTLCPKCGKGVVKKLKEKENGYSGVYQQQGRMIIDADWSESPRIMKDREKIAVINCASCGATNNATSGQCKNCGASL